MSYVDLKHRLADLTLEAVADPFKAVWVPLLVECGHGHKSAIFGAGVNWETLRANADRLGETFGWNPTLDALDHLVSAGILIRQGDRITIRPELRPYGDYLTKHTLSLISFLSRYIWKPTPPIKTIPVALWQGVLLFNDQLYFECHELLEGVWKRAAEPDRNFYHGIIQVAAAFYHYEKGNAHGVRTLLSKGLRRLETYPRSYLELDVADLRQTVAGWQRFLASGDRRGSQEVPIIRFTTDWKRLGMNY